MAEHAHSSSSTSTTASGSENNEEYPTRFRFYEPQIIKLDEVVDGHPNRFHFYDARQELAAVENIPLDDSTEEILRSLQETEVQRLSILNTDPIASALPSQPCTTADGANPEMGINNNPYEDAIKEALELLRKHRSPPVTPKVSTVPPITVNVKTNTAEPDDRARTPRDQDRLLQHRMDDDDEVDLALLDATLPTNAKSPDNLSGAYEEHKLKAKQRQERMAQYASRLEEFKSSLPAVTQRQEEDRLPQSHSGDYSDLSHSTKEQVEAEVQRGVERVLLAILERAHASRERSIQASLSDDNTSSQGGDMSDVLIRVMDELGLNSSDSRDQVSNIRSKTSGETDRTGLGSKRSTGTSVVDELLAEDEDDDIIEHDEGFHDKTSQVSLAVMSSPQAHSSIHPHFGNAWGPSEEKKLPDSQEKINHNNHVHPYNSTEELDEDDVDRLMDECLLSHSDDAVPLDNHHGDVYHDEVSQDGHKQLQGVLGPLSKDGNITGVVLDLDGDDSIIASSRQQKDIEHSSSSSKYKSQFAKSTNYNNGASSATQGDGDDGMVEEESLDSRIKPQEEEFSNGQHPTRMEEDDGSNSHADDFEAAELMRTLCAHFLPFGVDKRFNRLIESIPDWDESNPNEAGYRIIRLSRLQLQRVELAFERMINRLKQKSEQQLGELAGDAQFARELLEAERLLDESEERRLTTVDSAKSQKDSVKSNATSAAGDFIVAGDSGTKDKQQELSFVLDEDDDCHPNFPGVKAIGKGEMGDLEYFHLPIIFKSHVTGFEPTKDLVLEPGNVVAGQYLVESELGSAAFSTAYRCIDLSTEGEDGHEEVCLKVIKNTKDFFDQSLDEIKILELLRQTGKVHENYIVEMKCFFYYREHLIIVTELLRQNLFEFGKFIMDNNEEPYFTISRLAYITRQALISLQFVHSLGLVHSDVKPENMLLSSYSRAQIKLIDFGSSCYLTDRQSSYIQSRSYRAPEVILGLPYDGKIDVWSLGCVVAEMFTGEVTFQNDSIVSMLSRIEAICGPFPRHMIAQGRQSGRFFTKSGLLYEVVDAQDLGDVHKSAPGPHDDEDDDEEFHTAMQFDIFQPKNTRLCCRLGFDADLMDDFDQETCTSKSRDLERRHQQLFTDFVRQLLTIDPDGRPTAAQALQHPWMRYAAALTEEAVKYPSS